MHQFTRAPPAERLPERTQSPLSHLWVDLGRSGWPRLALEAFGAVLCGLLEIGQDGFDDTRLEQRLWVVEFLAFGIDDLEQLGFVVMT